MTDTEQLVLVHRFTAALVTRDAAALRTLCSPDVTWTVPGTSALAGVHTGVEGVLAVERFLVGRGLQSQVRGVFHGRDSVVVLLRDSGTTGVRSLDVDVALHVSVRDGEVAAVAGHLANLAAFDAYLS